MYLFDSGILDYLVDDIVEIIASLIYLVEIAEIYI
jgi:hypothetical protein